MKQDDQGIQTAFGGRDVRNTFITIFPKCFRERLSMSSGGMKEDESVSRHETAWRKEGVGKLN